MEDKNLICSKLLEAFQLTDYFHDMVALEYSPLHETVTATFRSGGKKHANVALDSGIAMIRDICRQIR